jgi:hypothetical protein
MDIDRVVLRACLEKISRNENVEENVRDVEPVLRKYADAADETQRFIRKREESDFLKNQLDVDDLKNVGNFKSRRKNLKDGRIVIFCNDSQSIEFYFKKSAYSTNSFLSDMLAPDSQFDKEEIHKITEGLVCDVLSDKNYRHPSEYLSGQKSRTLGSYLLDHVDVTESRNLFGFVPWLPLRVTVYRSNMK